MGASIVVGKYVICKITGIDTAQVITDGAVLQQDGLIVEVGAYSDLKAKHPDVEVIGSDKFIVMPGLVNDHFHVGLTPFQLGAPDLPLELWNLARMGSRGVDPYLDQLYGALLMIESGVTTVQTMPKNGRGNSPLDSKMVEKVIRAYTESGMRVAYAIPVADQNLLATTGADGGDDIFLATLPPSLANSYKETVSNEYVSTDEVVSFLEDVFAQYGGNKFERVKITLGPRTVFYCSDDLLVAYKKLAQKHQTFIHIHLLASVYEKFYSMRTWGKSSLQHLNDLNFLGPEVICGHSVWINEEDIDALAASGACVCHNASSNLRLQSGIPPINNLLERGIRVAIGSDEGGINDDKDLFQEMRMVKNLHRVPFIESKPPTSHQVFQMATENGAYAAGFGDRVGTLEPGKRADMVLVDLKNIEEPFLDPDISIIDALVHRGRASDVDTVMVDGEVVLRERRHTRVDKAAIVNAIHKELNRPLLPQEIKLRKMRTQLEPYVRCFYSGSGKCPAHPYYHFNARE